MAIKLGTAIAFIILLAFIFLLILTVLVLFEAFDKGYFCDSACPYKVKPSEPEDTDE